MSEFKEIILKQGKDFPVKQRHHWVFSGAIQLKDQIESGEIVKVFSFDRKLLGHGFYNPQTSIAIRMINFDSSDPIESLKNNIKNAIELRLKLFNDLSTNCYRVINGESDLISGLVVDRYNEVLVIQIVSAGIENLKEMIINELLSNFKQNNVEIKGIYENSNQNARRIEGLKQVDKLHLGEEKDFTQRVVENGVIFEIDLKNSQKTGLFLDQREMRKLVGEISKGKKVLNTFSYSGGFSLYAALNGAQKVVSIDLDKRAVEASKLNFGLNNLPVNKENFIVGDVFEFIHSQPLEFDLIILDPPAFAQKKQDIPNAQKGYYNLNKTVLSKMPKGSFLLTCSCSYHFDFEMFKKVVSKAGIDSGKTIKVLQEHRLASDHPLSLYHTELDYIKSLLLYVD